VRAFTLHAIDQLAALMWDADGSGSEVRPSAACQRNGVRCGRLLLCQLDCCCSDFEYQYYSARLAAWLQD
jgi:hypothetical protein